MQAKFTHGGVLKYDYTGAHVTYTQNGREYLGQITGTYRDEDEVLHFTVRHLNGEPAPDVAAGKVNVLERTYEDSEEQP